MGQHSVPEEPPPPKDKPRYRFLVAIGGIVALAFTAMAIVAAVFPETSPAEAGPDVTQVADPFPPLPTVDTAGPATSPPESPGPTSAPVSTPAPTTSSSEPGPRDTATSAPTTAPAPSGNVTGSYAEFNRWDTGFQAAITLVNHTSSPQKWQVTVVFADTVKPTGTTWIDGEPEPKMVPDSHGATYSGVNPIAPGGKIKLNIQMEKSGGNTAPLVCTVNGQTCSID